jgi:hypothetical protein
LVAGFLRVDEIVSKVAAGGVEGVANTRESFAALEVDTGSLGFSRSRSAQDFRRVEAQAEKDDKKSA